MNGNRFKLAVVFFLATLALGGDSRGAQQSTEGDASRFSISSDLVLVNATVLDMRGRPVNSLTRENFHIFENQTEKKIEYFSEEETPVSMIVVADTSGSMAGKLPGCVEAIARLFDGATPGDEFALITLGSQAVLAREWTRNDANLRDVLANTRAHGSTALLDALHMAALYSRTAANARRLVFIVSDSGENHSRFRERDVRRLLEETELEMYAVDIRGPDRALEPEVLEGPGLLDRLCEEAAGRYIAIDRMSELPKAVERISREIRSQYMLGYRPAAIGQAGRFHKVEVRVHPPSGMHRLSVRWRRGWREPAEGKVD